LHARDVPWLAEIQRPPETLPDITPRLGALLSDQSGKPITDRAAWEQRRADVRQWWLEFLGAWEEPPVSNQIEVVSS
jgi:hypothetical protein